MLLLNSFSTMAQKPNAWYNHATMLVHNLDTSVAFYTKVFQVDTIPCPFASNSVIRIKWLNVGDGVELHLAQQFADTAKSVIPLHSGQIGFEHLGFMVTSMDAFITRLNEVSCDYRTGKLKPEMDTMPYGAKSANIQDPDGNVIHIIEAMPSKK